MNRVYDPRNIDIVEEYQHKLNEGKALIKFTRG